MTSPNEPQLQPTQIGWLTFPNTPHPQPTQVGWWAVAYVIPAASYPSENLYPSGMLYPTEPG